MFNVILKSAFLIGGITLAIKAKGTSKEWEAALGSWDADSIKSI